MHTNNLIILLSLLCFFGCSMITGNNPSYPVLIEKNEVPKLLELGYIQDAIIHLEEGKKTQYAIFNLSEEGKKAKYEETGYQEGDIGYYKIIVTNPYTFEEFLEEHEIPLQGTETVY